MISRRLRSYIDDRLKQMFGGATHQEMLAGRAVRSAPTTKPGGAGYL